MRLALHLLDPARPEYSAAFVGKLIITFIKKVRGSRAGGAEGVRVCAPPLPGRPSSGPVPPAVAEVSAEQDAEYKDVQRHAEPAYGLCSSPAN